MIQNTIATTYVCTRSAIIDIFSTAKIHCCGQLRINVFFTEIPVCFAFSWLIYRALYLNVHAKSRVGSFSDLCSKILITAFDNKHLH